MTTLTQTQPDTFDQFAVVEMLGHRRTAGRVREVQIAGAGFLRLDIPATDGHGEQTQYVAPGSIYALHPVDEATARAVAAHCRPEPVHRWELPAAPEVFDPEEDLGDEVDDLADVPEWERQAIDQQYAGRIAGTGD